MKKIITAIVALSMLTGPVFAQEVRFTDKTMPVEVNAQEEAEADEESESEGSEIVELSDFHLLALEDDKVLLWQDNRKFYVSQETLNDLIQLVELPEISEVEPVLHGTKGDEAKAFQEDLIELGFLEGEADGAYGKGTRGAVKAFQESTGLEVTGDGDAATLLLAKSMVEDNPIETTVEIDPNVLFATISEEIPLDYSPLLDTNFKVQYDDLTGIGFIAIGDPIEYEKNASSDLNSSKCTLRLGFDLNGNSHSCVPVIIAECEGARRPYIQSLVTKAGTTRMEIEAKSVSSEAVGPFSSETATFEFTEEQLSAFKDVSEELQIRITGELMQYDIRTETETVKAWAEAGSALLSK